ncbi:MAG: NAD(P)/FAD-dependent oxidoreductase [DPANN group archaeon]|nr:NAD(P)/FAD-dependent oxidoreductase [DPANN group archaeon]
MEDVIIVGAGPAGCNLANLLAKAGLKVSVFESLPDEKTHFCGELIDVVDAEESTGLKFGKDLILSRYENAKLIFADNGKELSIPFPQKRKFWLVNAELLKTRLKEAAESHGAKFVFNRRVSTVVKQGNKVIGVRSGKSIFPAKIVVGCDGSSSIVARTAGFDRSGYKVLPSFRWRFKNCGKMDAKSAEFYLFEKLGVGYLWLYPFAENKCNVGIGGINSPKIHEIFNEFVKTAPALKGAKAYYKGAEVIPYTGFLPKISMPGCVLVGESAGQIYSLVGGGVNPALFASKLASETIIKVLRENSYDKGGLAEYDISYRGSRDGIGIESATKGVFGIIELHKRKNVVALLDKATDLLTPEIISKGAMGTLTVFDKFGLFLRHPVAFIRLVIAFLT